MIVWFGGGLGNQLFQFTLYMMALNKGFNVKADLSMFDKYLLHNGFELGKIFGINLKEVDSEELCQYKPKGSIAARLIRKVGFESYGSCKDVFRENKSHFVPDLLTSKNQNLYLQGYWQSEQYFFSIKDLIKELLVFPELNNQNKLIFENMENSFSVSIHIRRGDYLKSNNRKIYNDLSSTDYYKKSIDYFNDRFERVLYFVFSDDITWCKQNLTLPSDTVYVDHNKGAEGYRDMQLMSLCKHNIIANSSFSWWGAYLNNYHDKIIIAPQRWFLANCAYDDSRIIPSEWLKI